LFEGITDTFERDGSGNADPKTAGAVATIVRRVIASTVIGAAVVIRRVIARAIVRAAVVVVAIGAMIGFAPSMIVPVFVSVLILMLILGEGAGRHEHDSGENGESEGFCIHALFDVATYRLFNAALNSACHGFLDVHEGRETIETAYLFRNKGL
jgi:hypothetical protein